MMIRLKDLNIEDLSVKRCLGVREENSSMLINLYLAIQEDGITSIVLLKLHLTAS